MALRAAISVATALRREAEIERMAEVERIGAAVEEPPGCSVAPKDAADERRLDEARSLVEVGRVGNSDAVGLEAGRLGCLRDEGVLAASCR